MPEPAGASGPMGVGIILMALIQLDDIHFTYPGTGREVLRGASLSFEGGKVGLIGPNGSGKTTLLHIIMGLVAPASGRVIFKGTELAGEESFGRLRRRVGFLFQNADDQLFSPTVLEDVAFGPLNLGKTPDEARNIALRTLDRLGLEGFEDRITHRLSGGEKKLVALATILSMEPEALLLDEPTNDLDPDTRLRLMQILGDLGLPYIIISHDWDFLHHTVEELWGVRDGKVVVMEHAELHSHVHLHEGGGQPHKHENGHGRKTHCSADPCGHVGEDHAHSHGHEHAHEHSHGSGGDSGESENAEGGVHGEDVHGEAAHGDNAHGDNAHGEAAHGENAHGKAAHGKDVRG